MSDVILGLDKLRRKLDRLENAEHIIKRGLENYAHDQAVQGRAEAYAPESAANRSTGRYSWYVRGAGTQTRTGLRYNKSQKMSNRWNDWPVKILGHTVRLEVKNTADYSGYVVGEKQAWFHKARGWEKTKDVLEDTLPRAVREISKEIDKELSK